MEQTSTVPSRWERFLTNALDIVYYLRDKSGNGEFRHFLNLLSDGTSSTYSSANRPVRFINDWISWTQNFHHHGWKTAKIVCCGTDEQGRDIYQLCLRFAFITDHWFLSGRSTTGRLVSSLACLRVTGGRIDSFWCVLRIPALFSTMMVAIVVSAILRKASVVIYARSRRCHVGGHHCIAGMAPHARTIRSISIGREEERICRSSSRDGSF